MVDRSSLLAAKLRVLADATDAEPAGFPAGAALVDGSRAWLLLDAHPVTAFGPALVWARRHDATEVTLIVDDPAAAIVARRASLFTSPPVVLGVNGTSTIPVEAALTPIHPDAPPAAALAELLVDADLEVVVEDGIVRGEVLGLEVARIVHGTTTSGTPDRRARSRSGGW